MFLRARAVNREPNAGRLRVNGKWSDHDYYSSLH